MFKQHISVSRPRRRPHTPSRKCRSLSPNRTKRPAGIHYNTQHSLRPECRRILETLMEERKTVRSSMLSPIMEYHHQLTHNTFKPLGDKLPVYERAKIPACINWFSSPPKPRVSTKSIFNPPGNLVAEKSWTPHSGRTKFQTPHHDTTNFTNNFVKANSIPQIAICPTNYTHLVPPNKTTLKRSYIHSICSNSKFKADIYDDTSSPYSTKPIEVNVRATAKSPRFGIRASLKYLRSSTKRHKNARASAGSRSLDRSVIEKQTTWTSPAKPKSTMRFPREHLGEHPNGHSCSPSKYRNTECAVNQRRGDMIAASKLKKDELPLNEKINPTEIMENAVASPPPTCFFSSAPVGRVSTRRQSKPPGPTTLVLVPESSHLERSVRVSPPLDRSRQKLKTLVNYLRRRSTTTPGIVSTTRISLVKCLVDEVTSTSIEPPESQNNETNLLKEHAAVTNTPLRDHNAPSGGQSRKYAMFSDESPSESTLSKDDLSYATPLDKEPPRDYQYLWKKWVRHSTLPDFKSCKHISDANTDDGQMLKPEYKSLLVLDPSLAQRGHTRFGHGYNCKMLHNDNGSTYAAMNIKITPMKNYNNTSWGVYCVEFPFLSKQYENIN